MENSFKIVSYLAKKFPKQRANIESELKNSVNNVASRVDETDQKAFQISAISMRNSIFRQSSELIRVGPLVDIDANMIVTIMDPKKINLEKIAEIKSGAKKGEYNYGWSIKDDNVKPQEKFVGSFIEITPIENYPLFLDKVEFLFTCPTQLKDIDMFLSRELFEITKMSSFHKISNWVQHNVVKSIRYYVLFCFNKQGYPPYMFIASPNYLSNGMNICLGNSVYHASNFAATDTLKYIASTAQVISSFATDISGAMHLDVSNVNKNETQINLLKSYFASSLLNEIYLGGLMELVGIEQISTIAINELPSSQNKMKEAKINPEEVLEYNISRVNEAEKRREIRKIYNILKTKHDEVMISMTGIARNIQDHISSSAAKIFEFYITDNDLLACFICILHVCEILPYNFDASEQLNATMQNIANYQMVINGNKSAVDACPEAIKLAQIMADEGDLRTAAINMQNNIHLDSKLVKKMNISAFNRFIADTLLAKFDAEKAKELRTLFESVL